MVRVKITEPKPKLTSHIHPYKVEGIAIVCVLETVTAKGLETASRDGRNGMNAKADISTCFNFNKGILRENWTLFLRYRRRT